MKTQIRIISLSLVLFLSACNLGKVIDNGINDTSNQNPILTQAAMTLEVLSATQNAIEATEIIATSTPQATATDIPATATAAPPTPTQAICDLAGFVADVSIPDHTLLFPETPFTKIWRVDNLGECTWNDQYKLVFVSGEDMAGTHKSNLFAEIAKGENIDLWVDLKAPATIGNYVGYWMLENPAGFKFGSGANTDQAFWVNIEVIAKSSLGFYNFTNNICKTYWRNMTRDVKLFCAGTNVKNAGFVHIVENPPLENGADSNDLALWAYVPPNQSIRGEFPTVVVESGDHFKTRFGCVDGYSACKVEFTLKYRIEGTGDILELDSWVETVNNSDTLIDVDLSALDGEKIVFYFEFSDAGQTGQNHIYLINPIIQR